MLVEMHTIECWRAVLQYDGTSVIDWARFNVPPNTL